MTARGRVGLIAALAWTSTPFAARADPRPATTTDGVGSTLVLVPAGTFRMGSTDRQDDELRARSWQSAPPELDDLQLEKPQHEVRISKAFYLAAHEITVGQFRAFVAATHYVTDAEKGHRGGRGFGIHGGSDHRGQFESGPQYTWKSPGFPQGDDHPVVEVSWNDAVAFAGWLSRREKATYRLPTEAEWEYACRAGTRTWLNFGDDPSIAARHANLADVSLEKAHPGQVMRQRLVNVAQEPADGYAYTAPVGRFAANAWGLFDMHGNVWEWCQDRFSSSTYRRVDPQTVTVDPHGPVAPRPGVEPDTRVLRGGSWASDVVTARSSSRLWGNPTDAFCYAGFRLVREP